jgi:hypothetical protein
MPITLDALGIRSVATGGVIIYLIALSLIGEYREQRDYSHSLAIFGVTAGAARPLL